MDKLRALQYFIAAAEEGSLAGAARRLEVSVPSVHKLLAALEASLGVALFERHSRGLVLTASGDTYLESSRPLLEELAALDAAVSGPALRPGGTLVVAAHPQLAHHLLLPVLPRFRAAFPEIRIDLWEFERAGEAVKITASGGLRSNDREVVLAAALAGEGVVRVNVLTSLSHVRSGRLVPVLQDWKVTGGPPLNLLYRPQRQRTPRVRLFIDFVTAMLQDIVSPRALGERASPDRPFWHRHGSRRASSALRGGD